jgi:BsuBI/PstI restriction endonuclease HTH domain
MSVESRIQEARHVLEAFGMDAERSNERPASVLLSLLGLRPSDPWSAAVNPLLGTRAIMDFALVPPADGA